jgi:hypothetical protein
MSDLIAAFLLLALILLIWFWADSLRARERALRACAATCRGIGAQLLDQTVALRRLGLTRDPDGHAVWRRSYRFDYTLDGVTRLHGRATLRGREIEVLSLHSADGTVQYHQGPPHH